MSSIYCTFPRGVSQHMFTYSACFWLCFSALCKFPLQANIRNAVFASSCSESTQIQRLLSAATLAVPVIPSNIFINKTSYFMVLTYFCSKHYAFKTKKHNWKMATFRWLVTKEDGFLIIPLKPNNPYRGRTAPLTSKRCILYIYSTNIGTEYFKRGINCPFFPLQNAVCFIILTYLVPVLFTFYIQVC